MLTKNDLEQIRGVVREEVKTEVSKQIYTVKTDVATQIESVKTDVASQFKASEKRMSRKLHKMQNSILQYHDEYAIYLRERIEKLEEHTGLAKPKQN